MNVCSSVLILTEKKSKVNEEKTIPIKIGPPKPPTKFPGIEHGPPMNQRIEYKLHIYNILF